MKPVRTWILIADGAIARVVANFGPGRGIRPVEGLNFAGDHAANKEIMADKPGRSYESVSSARHALDYAADPHRELKRRFSHHLSDMLSARIADGDRLILVAAPAALGDLRAALTPAVRDKVTAEIDKDLTKIADAEIVGHVEKVIAL